MPARRRKRRWTLFARKMETDKIIETLDLRDLIEEEIRYRGMDESMIDKAVLYIKEREDLMAQIDSIVSAAVLSVE